MTDRRLVVEHKDGRRVSVLEGDFDSKERNPFNTDTVVHTADVANADPGAPARARPGRPSDQWVSLKEEGFKPVGVIDPETGHEKALGEDD